MTFLAPTMDNHEAGNWGRDSQYAACISPLLKALGWRGNSSQVIESMPHFSTSMDQIDFRSSLAHLNFESQPERTSLAAIDGRRMPCLFDADDGSVKVLLSSDQKGVHLFDSAIGEYIWCSDRKTLDQRGTVFFFTPVDREKIGQWSSGQNWFQSVLGRFKPLIWRILLATFVLNLLALATPLFIMTVYDLVIGSSSVDTLYFLLAGVGIAIFCDIVLRVLRSTMLAHIGARLDFIIGSAVLEKILSLPTTMTERTSLGSKIARFREFDMVREFFTGPLALAFLELPFVFIFLTAIGVIGGPLLFIPLGMLVLYGLSGYFLFPALQRKTDSSVANSAARGAFITESFNNMRSIKQMAAEEIWLDRYRDISAGTAEANFRSAMISAYTQAFAHIVMISSGILTLLVGIDRVFDGLMTIGALVASMALVWRLLAPMQTLFLAMTRLQQIGISIKRINQLFTLKSERNPYASTMLKEFDGRVTFSRVSFRYLVDQDPAVIGIDLDIKPGEVIAFVGSNSSGKSTIVKLLAGLYQPQVGGIAIDGVDIRQIDPLELRKAIGYMPQNCELFHGSIKQNLLLANSAASDDQVMEACAWANLSEDIDMLPEKIDTRIGDQVLRQLPAGFLQRLIMARAFLNDARIMIFDEPGNTLDDDGDRAFLEAVEKMRKKATVLIVTHRPSHMRAADRVVLLNRGAIQMIGNPETVIPIVLGGS